MANPDLNVSLGLVTRDFERSLKRVEKRMKAFARDLDRTGASITQSLSAPLALAGGAALTSAAKFEQLEKALIAVTGSSDEANAQLLRLQKIAEAPGIGFNQAVAASLQLQGLGVEAGRAEEAIRQVANVVAASGGGATEFAGVVRQLNQIQAKNRVLQEDLNILLENAPVVGEVLQQAFGAKTAEEIRARGIDGEEFFDTLVEGLSKVERVETGLFNTFENFGIQLEFTLARVGKAIDETFDVKGILDRMIRVIENMTEVFVNLDDATRRNLLRFTALVVVSGPLLQIGSRLVTVYSGVFAVFRTGIKALTTVTARMQLLASGAGATGPKMSALGKKVKGVTGAFRALSLAQQIVLGLFATGVIVAAAAVYDEYTTNVRAATAGMRALKDATKQAEESTKAERVAILNIKRELEDENLTREDKADIIERLKFINPTYFSDLDTEKSKIRDIVGALDTYNKALVLTRKKELLVDKLSETELTLEGEGFGEAVEENISLLDKLQAGGALALSNLSGNYKLYSNTVASEIGEATAVTVNGLNNTVSAVEQAIKDIDAELKTLGGGTSPVDSPTITPPGIAGETSIPDEPMTLFGEMMIPTGLQVIADQASNLDPLLEKLRSLGETVITVGEYINLSLGEGFAQLVVSGIDGIANSFGTLFENIIDGSQNAFQSFANALKDVAKQLVSTIIKAAVLATLFTVIFPGSIGAAGFGALFKKGLGGGLQGILGLELADGGIVTGPTPALIGEAGPEAVIPLSEMDKLLGSNQVEVIGRVSGEDIYFSNRRAGQRLSRSNG